MAIDPFKLKVGDRCWLVDSYRMGNTTQRSLAVYDIIVREISEISRYGDRRISVRWNGLNDEVWASGHKNWGKCQKTLSTVLGAYSSERRLRRGEVPKPGDRTRHYGPDGKRTDTQH